MCAANFNFKIKRRIENKKYPGDSLLSVSAIYLSLCFSHCNKVYLSNQNQSYRKCSIFIAYIYIYIYACLRLWGARCMNTASLNEIKILWGVHYWWVLRRFCRTAFGKVMAEWSDVKNEAIPWALFIFVCVYQNCIKNLWMIYDEASLITKQTRANWQRGKHEWIRDNRNWRCYLSAWINLSNKLGNFSPRVEDFFLLHVA